MKKASLLIFLISVGYIPSLLFFFWIDQNCHLPSILSFLKFPWFTFLNFTFSEQIVWNLFLILGFGAVHSALAQPTLRRKFFFFMKEETHRALYVIITGVNVLWVMGGWQQSKVVLWKLFRSDWQVSVFSEFLFFAFMGLAVRTGMLLNAQDLSGLNPWMKDGAVQPQLQSLSQPNSLIEKGLYRRCRHPIYLLTLAAILITPEMTIDRLTVFLGMLLYLCVGIPIEERKLIREMGPHYQDYQRRVPSLVPRLFEKSQSTESTRSLDSI